MNNSKILGCPLSISSRRNGFNCVVHPVGQPFHLDGSPDVAVSDGESLRVRPISVYWGTEKN